MNCERRIEDDLEGSGRGQPDVLLRFLLLVTEGNNCHLHSRLACCAAVVTTRTSRIKGGTQTSIVTFTNPLVSPWFRRTNPCLCTHLNSLQYYPPMYILSLFFSHIEHFHKIHCWRPNFRMSLSFSLPITWLDYVNKLFYVVKWEVELCGLAEWPYGREISPQGFKNMQTDIWWNCCRTEHNILQRRRKYWLFHDRLSITSLSIQK